MHFCLLFQLKNYDFFPKTHLVAIPVYRTTPTQK